MNTNNISDLKQFFIWCTHNKITAKLNDESFLINEYTLMKPEFIINNRIYVDLVKQSEITTDYISKCKKFAKSFGTIILFPREMLYDLHLITKSDIELKYDIKF